MQLLIPTARRVWGRHRDERLERRGVAEREDEADHLTDRAGLWHEGEQLRRREIWRQARRIAARHNWVGNAGILQTRRKVADPRQPRIPDRREASETMRRDAVDETRKHGRELRGRGDRNRQSLHVADRGRRE